MIAIIILSAVFVAVMVLWWIYGGLKETVGDMLMGLFPGDPIRLNDKAEIFLNGKYNRKATITDISADKVVIYGKVPLPVDYRGKFYAVGVDTSDGSKLIYLKNKKYYRYVKAAEIIRKAFSVLDDDERAEIILRGNINNGEWDFNALKVDDIWQDVNFDFIGLEMPKEKEKKSKKKQEEIEDPDPEAEFSEDDPISYEVKDVLYESDNIFEIPNLLIEQQAGKLELPFSPWGANSRLRKDVVTYHFYVDDYRFEKLWKDPINLLTSGCKAIVEPNCSCHDQTPIAMGIQLIYKKRWLSRYLQECGIKVYADLNVSHKFIEYNKMGIPKGYNAFFTRGLDGWMESLKSDLQVAQEISGLEKPNLLVYGGGDEIKEFCRKHGLLYVTDFINAKKK